MSNDCIDQASGTMHRSEELHFVAITDSSGRVLVSRPLPSAALADHVTNFLDSG